MNRMFEQEYFYPFEEYGLTTTLIALNTTDNTSFPILNLALTDIANNFNPKWNQTKTRSSLNGILMESRTVSVQLKRTTSSKVYVGVLYSMSWVLSGTVVFITAVVCFASKNAIGDSVALLPVAMVITLPRLRDLFPDGPAFGEPVLDFFC